MLADALRRAHHSRILWRSEARPLQESRQDARPGGEQRRLGRGWQVGMVSDGTVADGGSQN
jgi:hypothetical protein